jgi:hypothetical protein
MEERARGQRAEAARAPSPADSEALQRNYVTPGLSGQPITTVDSSKAFTPNLACQKTATLMEVLVPTGLLRRPGLSFRSRGDTDFDGTVDSRINLPVPVSGICANGVISCQPGTWNQCNYFRWDMDTARNLKLTQVDMPQLAGCYCINNSCGDQSRLGQHGPRCSGDLGGGMIGALTTGRSTHRCRAGDDRRPLDPLCRRPSRPPARAGPLACPDRLSRQPQRARGRCIRSGVPATMCSSRYPARRSATGTAQQLRHCTIERQVTVVKSGIDDIITRTSGGYSTIKSGKAVDFYLGSPSDNSPFRGKLPPVRLQR